MWGLLEKRQIDDPFNVKKLAYHAYSQGDHIEYEDHQEDLVFVFSQEAHGLYPLILKQNIINDYPGYVKVQTGFFMYRFFSGFRLCPGFPVPNRPVSCLKVFLLSAGRAPG